MIYPFISNKNGVIDYNANRIVLSGVKKLGNNALSHFCCRNTTGATTVDFPDLEEIGVRALDSGCAQSYCFIQSFPKVRIIKEYGLYRLFYGASHPTGNSRIISSLVFPNLQVVEDYAFGECFYGVWIKDLRFPSLTTVYQYSFYNMLLGTYNSVSVHFPASMQSIITGIVQQADTCFGSSNYSIGEANVYYDL